MARSAPFHFPFSPPDAPEAAALARAASYLLRAANEVETGRLLTIGFSAGDTPLADLPSALASAAHLCSAVAESRPRQTGSR